MYTQANGGASILNLVKTDAAIKEEVKDEPYSDVGFINEAEMRFYNATYPRMNGLYRCRRTLEITVDRLMIIRPKIMKRDIKKENVD